MVENVFGTRHLCRNDRENILLQLRTESEYILMRYLVKLNQNYVR